jgi:aspartate/methionine/tyrosine aminotransferase
MRLEPFKIERYFARYEFTTEYLLCSSDCESVTVANLLRLEPGAEAALQGQWLGYTESQGDPALREAISGIYETVSGDQVLVHSGAEEGIFGFMNALLGPGDHVVVHAPCYQSLREVAQGLGAEVTDWPADPDRAWALDPEFLEAAVRPNTKAVVINTPHNPTGYLMPREILDAVIGIARHHDLVLFCDEVYRELEHDPADRLPAACDLYERAVSLGVLSKTYGLPGLRIGWIATRDRDLHARMAAFKDYLTICNAAPSEFLARIALAHRHALAERNRHIVLENLDLLDGFFARHAERFAWQRPKAGPIAFPALRQGTAEAFCRDLVERAGVLLLPSRVYDFGDRHFRIGFGRRNLPEALGRLEDHLSGPPRPQP